MSNDPAPSDLPVIAAAGNNVYVAWQNISSSHLNNADILFKASNNNGSSFGPVINLSNTPNENSVSQHVAAVGSDVYVVWQDNVSSTNDDIFFRASTNNGASFGAVINLSNDAKDSTKPQIAAVGTNVYVVWQTSTSAPTDIFFKASTNNGATFGTVINLSSSSHSTSALDPQIAAVGTFVYVTYTSNSLGNAQTFLTVSSNSGTSFGTPFTLGKTVTGETDFMPQIAATGSSVFLAWTNDTVNNDETMLRSSTKNGAQTSFSATIDLSNNPTTSLNTRLAAVGSNVYVIWTDSVAVGGTEVFYRASNNNGTSFASTLVFGNSAGIVLTPTVAASSSNVYIAWTNSTSSNDEVLLVSSSDNGVTFRNILNLSNNSGFSDDPVVAGVGNNVYVAWQDDTPGNDDVLFRAGTVVTIAPPIANPGALNSFRNQTVPLLLGGTDPQGLSLVFSIVTMPTHGTLGPISQSAPNVAQVSYTPSLNYLGADSFTFKVNNGSLDSSSATVSITVLQPGVSTGGRWVD